MATEEHAKLFLELVTDGVQKVGTDLGRVAGQATEASKEANRSAQAFRNLAEGWKSIRSGEFAQRAQETAILTREQAKLTAEMRRQTILATEGKLVGHLTLMQEKLQGVGRVGAYAFGLLTVGVGGWVRAGLAGTAEMNRFNLAMSQISKEIAGAFVPWIHKAIDFVTQLADRFRRMSGEQQEQIRRWVATTAAISGTMILLPRLVTMLGLVTKAFQAVGIAKFAALGGPIGIGIAAAGAVAVGAVAATPGGRDALGKLLESAQPLFDALGRLGQAALPIAEEFAKLAAELAQALVPVVTALAEGLAQAVDVLAVFVEGLGKAINWMSKTGILTALIPGGGLLKLLGGGEAPAAPEVAGGRSAQKTSVSAAAGGFEGAADLFKRIAGTAAKTDQARAADAAEATKEELQKIAAQLAKLTGIPVEMAMDRVRVSPGAGAS